MTWPKSCFCTRRRLAMMTKRISCERVVRVLAGLTVLGSLGLGRLHHPLWLIAAAGTALDLLFSGIIDRCVVRSLLVRMGFPRERDLGRAGAIGSRGFPSGRPRPSNRLASAGAA